MSARRTRQAQLNAGTANADTSNAETANAAPADKALAWPGDPNAVTAETIDFEALAHVLANTCLWGGARPAVFIPWPARAVIVSEEIDALDGLADEEPPRLGAPCAAGRRPPPPGWVMRKPAAPPRQELPNGPNARAARWTGRYWRAAGLDPELPGEWVELLRFVRRMTGAAERRDLPDAATHAGAGTAFPPLKRRIRPVGPGRAARQWLERFQALKGPPRDALHSGSLNKAHEQTSEQKHDQEKKDVTHLQTKEQVQTEPAQRGVEAEHEKEQESEHEEERGAA